MLALATTRRAAAQYLRDARHDLRASLAYGAAVAYRLAFARAYRDGRVTVARTLDISALRTLAR